MLTSKAYKWANSNEMFPNMTLIANGTSKIVVTISNTGDKYHTDNARITFPFTSSTTRSGLSPPCVISIASQNSKQRSAQLSKSDRTCVCAVHTSVQLYLHRIILSRHSCYECYTATPSLALRKPWARAMYLAIVYEATDALDTYCITTSQWLVNEKYPRLKHNKWVLTFRFFSSITWHTLR